MYANMPVPWYGVPVFFWSASPLGLILPNFQGDSKTTWTHSRESEAGSFGGDATMELLLEGGV